jgi:hypothetical protein
MGGGGKQSFTLINRGVKKVFELKYHVYRVLISIITNRKKEDSENAISNDLETPNFQNFPALRQPW